jgi:hypothetical protein
MLIHLLIRGLCPHDNIHQIYYNFNTGIVTYFLKAFEFHLPIDLQNNKNIDFCLVKVVWEYNVLASQKTYEQEHSPVLLYGWVIHFTSVLF